MCACSSWPAESQTEGVVLKEERMNFRYIAGFMSRGEAERRLMFEGKVGSFLLRFSDGSLGGISIVGLQHSKEIMARRWVKRFDADTP